MIKKMRETFLILIIISFIGITAFGFLAMGEHGPGHNFGSCIAVLQGEIDCSVFEGLVSFASFHLNALKVFSSANFMATTITLLLFLAVIIFSPILQKRLFNLGFPERTLLAAVIYSSGYNFRTYLEMSLKSWFALREMRDAAFLS